MAVILGIDAAWTPTGSSGIALLKSIGGNARPEIVASAASYSGFLDLTLEKPHSPAAKPRLVRDELDVQATLHAAKRLAGMGVDLVAIDMPLSTKTIDGRRPKVDDAVSKVYGARWAGVHSPTEQRPGTIGSEMTKSFCRAGFRLAVTDTELARDAIIEVFPLAALVDLMQLEKRPRYKIGKLHRSWRDEPKELRLPKLLDEWRKIVDALRAEIDFDFDVPAVGTKLADLKAHEDVLDAIVCAWIGWRAKNGRASPIGDADAAIWIPTPPSRA